MVEPQGDAGEGVGGPGKGLLGVAEVVGGSGQDVLRVVQIVLGVVQVRGHAVHLGAVQRLACAELPGPRSAPVLNARQRSVLSAAARRR